MSKFVKQTLSEIHKINHIRTNNILFSLSENYTQLQFDDTLDCNVYNDLSAGLYKITIHGINYCFLIDYSISNENNLFIYNIQNLYIIHGKKRKCIKLYLIEDVLDRDIKGSISYTQTKRYDTYIKLDKNSIPPKWHKDYIIIKPNNSSHIDTRMYLDKYSIPPKDKKILLSSIINYNNLAEESVKYNNVLLSNGKYNNAFNTINLYNSFFYNKKTERIESANRVGDLSIVSLNSCSGVKIEQYLYNNVLLSNGTYNEDTNVISIPSNFVYDEKLKRIVFDQYEYDNFGSTSFIINNTVNSYLDGIIIEGKTYDSFKDINALCKLTSIDAIKIQTSSIENDADDLLKIKLKNPIKSLPSGHYDTLYINCNTCDAFIINNVIRLALTGSEKWELIDSLSDYNYNVFKLKYDNMSINTDKDCIICSHLNSIGFDDLSSHDGICISIGNTIDTRGIYIKLQKDLVKDLVEFKKFLKDNMLNYNTLIVDYLSSEPTVKSILLDEYHVKTYFNKTVVKINVDSRVTLLSKFFK